MIVPFELLALAAEKLPGLYRGIVQAADLVIKNANPIPLDPTQSNDLVQPAVGAFMGGTLGYFYGRRQDRLNPHEQNRNGTTTGAGLGALAGALLGVLANQIDRVFSN